jgi:hypothetical protein
VRAPLLAIVVALAAGCSSGVPTRDAVGFDHIPQAPADVIANQPAVARGPSSVTLLPRSPRGVTVGKDYRFDMPHCGINSPIDVDGSYWDAIDVRPTSADFDGASGLFRLISATDATFTGSNDHVLRLVRHSGAKEFRLCS